MKEYNIIIHVEACIPARNQQQADERADVLLDALGLMQIGPKRVKWFPDDIHKEINGVSEQ